ncbi:hypothetical protein DFH09DRAFT_163315 [Mycena vulgaris]|nr:hypothetical protein DFH09DRAFT_163315 [Mycena vulgaris]
MRAFLQDRQSHPDRRARCTESVRWVWRGWMDLWALRLGGASKEMITLDGRGANARARGTASQCEGLRRRGRGSVIRVGAGARDGGGGGHGAGRSGTRRGIPRVEARLRMRRATRTQAGREQVREDGTRCWASSDPGGDCGGGSSLRLEREERRGAGQEEKEDVEGGAKAGGGAWPVGAPGDLSSEGSQPRIGCDVMDGEARARCHRRGLEGECGHGWRGA